MNEWLNEERLLLLAVFLNNNLPYERTIMNSKMTLTAVLVASLFSSAAFAAPQVKSGSIYSGDGFLSVSDDKFQEALSSAQKNIVWLNTFGEGPVGEEYGYLSLTLNNAEGYKLKSIRFAENSGIQKLDKRKATLELNGTKLTLEEGIYFSNAAAAGSDANSLPSSEVLTVTNQLSLNKTDLKGDVINYYEAWSAGKFVNNSTEIR